MRKTLTSISLLAMMAISPMGMAGTGPLFTAVAAGNTLTIMPTVNPYYPSMGIKISSGQAVGGCTPISNGYCIFPASKTNPKVLSLKGTANNVQGVICLEGQAQYSCQNINLKPSICSPGRPCRVFLSSSSQDGKMIPFQPISGYSPKPGLEGGNGICQALADNAGLGGKWRAWLSTATVNAVDNINYDSNIEYVLSSNPNITIAPPNTLLSGFLSHPIDRTEKGIQPNLPAIDTVWTGTNKAGVVDNTFCQNWTDNTFLESGTVGSLDTAAVDGFWTASAAFGCNALRWIYCFEAPI